MQTIDELEKLVVTEPLMDVWNACSDFIINSGRPMSERIRAVHVIDKCLGEGPLEVTEADVLLLIWENSSDWVPTEDSRPPEAWAQKALKEIP